MMTIKTMTSIITTRAKINSDNDDDKSDNINHKKHDSYDDDKQNDNSNGSRTEWSPIRSVIIRVITKSDDRADGVRFVYHEYDYIPNWTTQSPIAN